MKKEKLLLTCSKHHFELNSPKYELHKKSIADYNEARTKMKVLAETVVRHHQPQEDVDTISKNEMLNIIVQVVENYMMIIVSILLHHQEMKLIVMVEQEKSLMRNTLSLDLGEEFARSYYRDEIKAKGLNPDFHVAINGNYDKRSPSYYTMETQVNKFTGHYNSSNDNKTTLSLQR